VAPKGDNGTLKERELRKVKGKENKMSKTRILNKTVTTALILLLTLSILSVINFVVIPLAIASPDNITMPTVGIAVNKTGYWKAGGAFTATSTPIQAALDAAASPDLNITVTTGTYTEALVVNTANIILRSDIGKVNTTIQLAGTVGINVKGTAANFTLGGGTGHGFTILSGAASTFDIQLENAPSGVTISYNRVNTTGLATQGISVGAAGATGLTVSNNDFIAETGDGSIWGPLVVNVTVSGNTFTSNSIVSGYAVEFASVTGTSTISGNNITGYAYGVFIIGSTADVVTGLTISTNIISSCNYGIRLGHSSATQDVENITVTGNTLSSNTKAIYIDSNAHVHPATFTILYNNINVNNLYGLKNAHATQVNATLNWWGHTTGPSDYGNGYGANVSTNVLYDPWLSAAYPSTTVFSGIWLKPTRASAGSTIEVFSSNLDFTAGETVRTYFEATLVNTTTASATNGSLYATFAVPSASPGTYDVTAIGLTSHVSYIATFTVPTLSITLSPTWGPPGTTVTVTGEGFTILGLVKIYFDGTYRTSDSANTYGNMSTYFTVPTTTLPGAHTVKANDFSTGNNATKPFTVPAPTITLDHYWGYPGQTITVSGGNFTKTGTVRIYFGTITAPVATTTASGGVISITFDVPSVLPSTYTVRAMDVATTCNATKSFTVPAPSITLSPDGGPPGTTVTVSGGNFTLNGAVRIYFDGTSVKNVTATAAGAIPAATTFNVPSVALGTYTVKATDVSTGYNATATFDVGPVIWIAPTSGPVGKQVTVTGAGFTFNGTVKIYFNSTGTLVKTVNATATGTISTTFFVPDAIAGAHNIIAYDVGTGTWTPPKTFTISTPSITLSPTFGPVYTNVTTVTGSNFKINGTVNIYFGGTSVKNTTADGTGAISTFFYVPDVLPEIYTVNATDGINYATATFHIIGAGGTTTITQMLTEIEHKLDTLNITLTVDLTPVLNAIAEIEAKLDVGGTFYTFVNTWFTTIGTKLDAIKAKTDLINWADITTIKSDVSAIKSAVGAPLPPIEGTVTCTTGGTVQVFNVTKAMTDGNPFKVYFTIDAQALDTLDQIYVNVYIKTTATSPLILARQTNIVGITGLYTYEVYIDSIVNAEQVVVELAWRAGTTSDDLINYQVVISSP